MSRPLDRSPARLWRALLLMGFSAGCMGKATFDRTAADGPTGALGAPGSPGSSPGNSGTPGNPGDPLTPPNCTSTTPSPGRAPLRHLTNQEYDNTVLELLGDNSHPSSAFPKDEPGLGYDNSADAYSISTAHAEKYLYAAEKLSGAVDLTRLLPCSPTAGTDACAATFIASFGARAFRRPLTDADKAMLQGVYAFGKAQVDFATGIRLTIEAALQTPDFLYRPEFGVGGSPGDIVPLTDHEMASRLSFFLWSSMPDAALFAAADAGELRTAAQVAAQARRMLADPRAHAMVAGFHTQWLSLGDLGAIEKDPTLYASFPTLRPLMQTEAAMFFDNLFWDPAADASSLFTSSLSFMNKPLATFYGVAGPTSATFQKVTLDPSKRRGFLTQAGLMSVYAKSNETHPVLRGKFVREKLFCQLLPPPPDNLQIVPPDPNPQLTTRQRYAEHSTNPLCAGCHTLTDPVGFGFENYDAVGKYRATENRLAIDASGALTATPDSNGTFNGAVELATRLSTSQTVKNCIATQWFRYATGREESPADACSLEEARKTFSASRYRLPELLVSLTQTDSFLFRQVIAPGGT